MIRVVLILIPWRAPEPFRRLLVRDPCYACGGRATGLDHIIPRSAGGPDGLENRAACCAVCDQAKADSPLLLWLLGRVCRATD